MSAVIEVTGLCKTYGEIKAVNNVSFAVMQGEVCGSSAPAPLSQKYPPNHTIAWLHKSAQQSGFFAVLRMTQWAISECHLRAVAVVLPQKDDPTQWAIQNGIYAKCHPGIYAVCHPERRRIVSPHKANDAYSCNQAL